MLSLSLRPLLRSLQLRLPIHTKLENLHLPSRNAVELALVLCLEAVARSPVETPGPAASLAVEDTARREGSEAKVVELPGEEGLEGDFTQQEEEESGLTLLLPAPARIPFVYMKWGCRRSGRLYPTC